MEKEDERRVMERTKSQKVGEENNSQRKNFHAHHHRGHHGHFDHLYHHESRASDESSLHLHLLLLHSGFCAFPNRVKQSYREAIALRPNIGSD
ncbi:hypothetical protein Tsubulata_043633 [Turnera subulata]|uniref:Uncharacterized protein n=1 Tax=Turnera subulata TaxID=218843 RepID=A0A9Q0G5F1_9ROSI|nr:hypothetical protein Tsubulata_043633 [Turnera subulata]